ncbi:hypothetical protein C8R44DRAFT_725612 [Mycena epipterygia]|nr:hypothetical protein C8R44DRAFT_725612 [Mycena epipterygia]
MIFTILSGLVSQIRNVFSSNFGPTSERRVPKSIPALEKLPPTQNNIKPTFKAGTAARTFVRLISRLGPRLSSQGSQIGMSGAVCIAERPGFSVQGRGPCDAMPSPHQHRTFNVFTTNLDPSSGGCRDHRKWSKNGLARSAEHVRTPSPTLVVIRLKRSELVVNEAGGRCFLWVDRTRMTRFALRSGPDWAQKKAVGGFGELDASIKH